MSDIYIPSGGSGNTTATYVTEADEHVALTNSYQLTAGTNVTLTAASGTPNTLTIASSGGSAAAGGSNGQIQYNNATALGGFTMSGDATLVTSTGVITVAKTGGVAFATSATTDTTNASNITTGTLAAAQLPAPTATTLGGVESLAAVTHKWINTISTAGVPSATQPAFTDISAGTLTAAQMLPLADTNIYVGNGSNQPVSVPMSGNVTLSDTGVATIATSVALAGSPTTTTQSAGDNSTKISTTAFVTTAVNNAIAGVNPAVAVAAATVAVLPAVPTYYNGVGNNGIGATLTASSGLLALVIDGYTVLLNDRILVKNQAAPADNGVYVQTTVGTNLIPYVLTRALDYDQATDINSTGAIPVINGTANAVTSWVISSTVVNVGTDAITYTQFTLNPTTLLTSTATGLVIALPFFMATGANTTIQLDAYAAFGYTINAIQGLATASGTITAAIQLGGTNVTGLSALSVTSTPQNATATALNVVSATNQVTLVLTSNAAALGLCFTLKMTRS